MNSSRLYAVKFKNGIVKIGMTSNIKARYRSLSYQVKSSIESAIHSPRMRHIGGAAERYALRRAAEMFPQFREGKEWFEFASFGAAKNLVRQAYRLHGGDQCGWKTFLFCSPTKFRGRDNIMRPVEAVKVEGAA